MAGPMIPTQIPVADPMQGVDPVEERAQALASIYIENATDDEAKERLAALRKRLGKARVLAALPSPSVAKFGAGIADDAASSIKSEEGNWGPEARALKLTLASLAAQTKLADRNMAGETARGVADISGRYRVEAAEKGGGMAQGRPQLTNLPNGQVAWATPPSKSNPSGMVTPAPLPSGAPAIKGKTLSATDIKRISDVTEKEANLTALLGEFEDAEKNLGGRGVGGDMGVRVAQFLASDADSVMGKGAQDRADFWSRFRMFYDLPIRHSLFGAQLTTGEREEWKRAQNIGPKTDPRIIKKNMGILIKLANKAARKMVGARIKDGYNPEALREATGWDALPPDLVAAPAAPAGPPSALPQTMGAVQPTAAPASGGVVRYVRDPQTGKPVRGQ